MTMEHIGRYEVVKELGTGAMAVVYKAVDPLIGRTVAIKTIKIDASVGLEHAELRQRFYREAQNAGNLNHPNIVTIYDIGAEGNVDYIAMEFVEGESLQDWMVKNPIPPVEQTVAIIEQIASGLDYAASHGIIHRDIKPANILLTLDMKAKIADFGIAKISTSKFTQTGAVIGTPSYMSPEQAMGKTLDGRTDIFSLGVIFYEMLTGEKPFTGTNPSTIIYKILHEEPVQPQQLNVTLHPAFNEIVGRMLAKDPDKRYQSCSQLIHDLKNYSSLEIKKEEPQIPAAATKAKAKSNAPEPCNRAGFCSHGGDRQSSVTSIFSNPGNRPCRIPQRFRLLRRNRKNRNHKKAPDVSVLDKAEPRSRSIKSQLRRTARSLHRKSSLPAQRNSRRLSKRSPGRRFALNLQPKAILLRFMTALRH